MSTFILPNSTWKFSGMASLDASVLSTLHIVLVYIFLKLQNILKYMHKQFLKNSKSFYYFKKGFFFFCIVDVLKKVSLVCSF